MTTFHSAEPVPLSCCGAHCDGLLRPLNESQPFLFLSIINYVLAATTSLKGTMCSSITIQYNIFWKLQFLLYYVKLLLSGFWWQSGHTHTIHLTEPFSEVRFWFLSLSVCVCVCVCVCVLLYSYLCEDQFESTTNGVRTFLGKWGPFGRSSLCRLRVRVRHLVWMVRVRERGYGIHFANKCPHYDSCTNMFVCVCVCV